MDHDDGRMGRKGGCMRPSSRGSSGKCNQSVKAQKREQAGLWPIVVASSSSSSPCGQALLRVAWGPCEREGQGGSLRSSSRRDILGAFIYGSPIGDCHSLVSIPVFPQAWKMGSQQWQPSSPSATAIR
ncbi:hypothetical protein M758_1G162500 [Ceratodon purpureus]|uniref:Uncharacterized protein n=1 Tax=Ceratodon purpureus TaxID=3225 RepID=A0A8T0J993_CERPU|nr:hypothetical protein KC19_1G166700 [Ceratodon purpureus]KAG0630210.1 hypothetical protein M758_1G162500 [Ceratodon purpureus]